MRNNGEKKAYAAFRKNVMRRADRINRVESPITPGMPDVSCCLRGGNEFWLEIKAPTEPVRLTTPLFGSNHKLSRDQANWIRSQIQAGGKAYIYISTDKRNVLICGTLADEINKLTVAEIVENSLWHAPKPVEAERWESLRWILCRSSD